MSQRYAGEVVFISGASGGLGQAAAIRFAKEGAKLALCDIAEPALEILVARLRDSGAEVLAAKCDVTDESQLENFMAEIVRFYGRLDVAINNAGIDPAHHRLADIPSDEFDRVMNVNVRGVFLCMKYQIKQMLTQGGGRILNVASVAGLVGAPEMAAYAASKHAVVGLTKSAAFEYGRKLIRINSICPSVTQTNMLDEALKGVADREQALKMFSANTALKRIAEPQEIIEGMLFACDKNNTYMVGQQLTIDGGLTAV